MLSKVITNYFYINTYKSKWVNINFVLYITIFLQILLDKLPITKKNFKKIEIVLIMNYYFFFGNYLTRKLP